MRFLLLLVAITFVSCQEKKPQTQAVQSAKVEPSVDIFAEPDAGCETAEITEEKIVQQAMKPAEIDTEGGALKGATDCEVN